MGSPEKNETMAYVLVTIMIVVIVLIVTCCCWIWYDLLDCKSYLEDRKQVLLFIYFSKKTREIKSIFYRNGK